MTQQTILMNAHVETYLDHEDLKMLEDLKEMQELYNRLLEHKEKS